MTIQWTTMFTTNKQQSYKFQFFLQHNIKNTSNLYLVFIGQRKEVSVNSIHSFVRNGSYRMEQREWNTGNQA